MNASERADGSTPDLIVPVVGFRQWRIVDGAPLSVYDGAPGRTGASLIGGAAVLWGRIEAHMYGLRGEHARIVALEFPLSRGRKRRAVIEAAERVAVPVVPHRSLQAVALEHGAVLQPALRPKKTLTRAANAWARNGPA